MTRRPSKSFSGSARWIVPLCCLAALSPRFASAQSNRITAAIDRTQTSVIRGSIPGALKRASDAGPAPTDRVLRHISINFKPLPAQQADLNQLLKDQQDPLSPQYHVWLTPEEFADRFSLTADDIDKVTAWLTTEGFTVTGSAAARNWISFDGTVGQAQTAFHTQIRQYRADGALHIANSTEISVPQAIASAVVSVLGLDDFLPKPPGRRAAQSGISPDYNNAQTGHALGPGDFAAIYNLTPLLNQQYYGSGQTIVVLGQSDVSTTDLLNFRNFFGLPATLPTFILAPGATDPGKTDAEVEADLDIEWAGALAKDASIVYVYSGNALTVSGQYALSPPKGTAYPGKVVTASFSYCEPDAGSLLSTFQTWAQNASTGGVTWVASSGDAGAAGCDMQGKYPDAQYGVAVNTPASVPEVTGVGGTCFNEAGTDCAGPGAASGSFWSATNNSGETSALGYIPEIGWNETASYGALVASGGGVSVYYQKPSWQTVSGVPSGTLRWVPDIAMSAAVHDPYVIFSEAYGPGAQYEGGTSAATPSFASILAILNQYVVAKGLQSTSGLGNINPLLYRLFSSSPSAFNDIRAGSNIVPCEPGTTDCTTGYFGYNAGAGYDPVTGLGSINAGNFATALGSKTSSSTVSLSFTSSTFTVTGSVTIVAKVTGAGSSVTPTGSVSFSIPNKSFGSVNLSGGLASLTVSGGQFAIGANTLTAVYDGDSNFSGSSASGILTVSQPTTTSAVIPSLAPNPAIEQLSASNQSIWYYSVTLQETAGVATTLTGFSIGGNNYSSSIAQFFGTASIPAHGSIASSVQSFGYTAPTSLALVFSGSDASGAKWTQTANVTLLGLPTTAAISLTSAPGVVAQNPAASSSCQWYQNLEVQELNGYPVSLTRFLADGIDLSSQIGAYFGSTSLPALGSLIAGICWSGVTPPATFTFEVDGTDQAGNTITATLPVQFQGPPSLVSGLSLSGASLPFTVASAGAAVSKSVSVNVPSGIAWSINVFPSNRTTSWLSVSPSAGVGPATVTVTANSSGLNTSAYKATLTFQAPEATPEFIDVPVSLTIGTNPAAISAVGNAASYTAPISPGSLITIYGSNLASTTLQEYNPPLPFSVAGTSVTIGGIPAAMLYVSGGQLNVQVPFTAPLGSDTVQVTSNGSGTSAIVTVVATAPGVFFGNNSRAIVEHNATFLPVTPSSPANANEEIVIYGTGTGPLSVSPATGAAADQGNQVSVCTSPTAVTINGVTARVDFCGLSPGFVGLMQIDAAVPPGLPAGDLPLSVSINGAKSESTIVAISGH